MTFPLHLIPAKAQLRRPVELPEYLPARMLNEFVYCPRLFFYEWVDGVFRQSSDTVDGAQRHERADSKEDEMPAPDGIEDLTFKARGVMLSSETLGLIAKLDLVEGLGGAVTPSLRAVRRVPNTYDRSRLQVPRRE